MRFEFPLLGDSSGSGGEPGPAGPPGPAGAPGPPGPPGGTVTDLSTKSPLLGWEGVPTLILGTSIAEVGETSDSYLASATFRLKATCVNNAWPGSRAVYDVDGDPFNTLTVRCLSMTQDDVDWGLATYGPTSAYNDSFDPTALASEQTCDHMIDAAFAVTPFQVVFFDHAHNDRDEEMGAAEDAETVNITSVTKGATTQVTLSSIGSIVVGNGIVLELEGIDNLNHAAVRVQAVAGSTITFNIDSSGYAGTFTSGTCTKYDRATVHGSFRFCWHRIRRAAFLAGVTDPIIIYSGAPSDYTHNVYDPTIRSTAEIIKTIADELGCAFFDSATRLNLSLDDQLVYFTDGVHPLTPASREPQANMWAEWLAGGAIRMTDYTHFVPAPKHLAGVIPSYIDQAPVIYSRFMQGAGTPNALAGATTLVFEDDFSAGFGTWVVGTSAVMPTIVAAPWGSGQAIQCVAPSATTPHASYITRTISLDQGRIVEFDLSLPEVLGLTSINAQVTFLQLRSAGAYYNFALRISPTLVRFTQSYSELPAGPVHALGPSIEFPLQADTKYRLRYEMYQGASADRPGALLFFLDDVLLGGPWEIIDWQQLGASKLYFGAQSSTTGEDFTIHLGNLAVSEFSVASIDDRVTGTLNGIDFVGGWATGGEAAATTDWTPTFGFATPGDSVFTYTTRVGKCAKLGNMVLITLELAFDINAYTTGTGVVEISGLPYPVASPGGALAMGAQSKITFSGAAFRLEAAPVTDKLHFRQVTSAAAFTNVTVTSFPASTTGVLIRASGMYWTD